MSSSGDDFYNFMGQLGCDPNEAQKVIATLDNICDYIRFLDKGPKYTD